MLYLSAMILLSHHCHGLLTQHPLEKKPVCQLGTQQRGLRNLAGGLLQVATKKLEKNCEGSLNGTKRMCATGMHGLDGMQRQVQRMECNGNGSSRGAGTQWVGSVGGRQCTSRIGNWLRLQRPVRQARELGEPGQGINEECVKLQGTSIPKSQNLQSRVSRLGGAEGRQHVMGVGFSCVCGGEFLTVFVGRKSPNLFEPCGSCCAAACRCRAWQGAGGRHAELLCELSTPLLTSLGCLAWSVLSFVGHRMLLLC